MAVLQTKVPEGVPWRFAPADRLPGLTPLPLEKWLLRDEVFDAQMALRDQYLHDRRDDVVAITDGARPAVEECLATVLTALQADDGYAFNKTSVVRPDGVEVSIDGNPLVVLGRLIQSDLCLMEAKDDDYVLTAAVLCFPASWRLSEKIGKPLPAIHTPVAAYDDNLAKRVQRVFEALRPGNVLTRANALLYDSPELHAQRAEAETRTSEFKRYMRTERQTLRRLPKTNAVVFGIHTTVLLLDDLPEEDQQRIRSAG